MITEKDLLRLKEDVEEAKTEAAELNGQKTALMKQLKDIWRCETIEEAQKKKEKLESDKKKIEEQIKKGIAELETKYEIKL